MKNSRASAQASCHLGNQATANRLRTGWLACLAACLVLGLTACRTQVPKEQLHPTSSQKKANAVEHWNQMAGQLCDVLLTNETTLQGKAVYLQCVGATDTDFIRAYQKLLTAELLRRSCTIVEQPGLAQVVVTVEPQLVQHGKRDIWWNPGTIFGTVGYWVVEFFTGSPYNQGLLTDPSTSQDLLITTFVRGGGKLLAGAVQIVYVPAGDYQLYGGKSTGAGSPGSWAEVEAQALHAINN
jgi:hypothetical protein